MKVACQPRVLDVQCALWLRGLRFPRRLLLWDAEEHRRRGFGPDGGYLFDPKLRILGQEQDLWETA